MSRDLNDVREQQAQRLWDRSRFGISKKLQRGWNWVSEGGERVENNIERAAKDSVMEALAGHDFGLGKVAVEWHDLTYIFKRVTLVAV